MSDTDTFDWDSASVEERKAAILAGRAGGVPIYTDAMTIEEKLAATDELFRVYGKEINDRIHHLVETGESRQETLHAA